MNDRERVSRESLLPLVAQVEQEIEALLEASRGEAKSILAEAHRQAGEIVRQERAGLATAEQAAYEEVLASGDNLLQEIAAEGTRLLAVLQQKVRERMDAAVQAVVDLVTGEERT